MNTTQPPTAGQEADIPLSVQLQTALKECGDAKDAASALAAQLAAMTEELKGTKEKLADSEKMLAAAQVGLLNEGAIQAKLISQVEQLTLRAQKAEAEIQPLNVKVAMKMAEVGVEPVQHAQNLQAKQADANKSYTQQCRDAKANAVGGSIPVSN
jgi:chromosome segregation ATPase